MRVVSLLPSATEIVCALGLRDQLTGIGHLCDYPPEVAGLPLVTRPAPASPDRAPEAGVPAELRGVELDDEALLEARPELVVCRDSDGAATGVARLRDALRPLAEEPSVLSLDAVSLEGIFHSITTIGAMMETEDEAVGLIEILREQLGELAETAVARQERGVAARRVVVLQGLKPLLTCGRWVPEQVRRAGGWELLGSEGEPPGPTTWEAIRDVDPAMLVVAPAGMRLEEAIEAWRCLTLPPFWAELTAVARGQVFVVEPVYLGRPGPRIVDGVGLLAEIFDPEAFVDTSPPYSWTPVSG